MKKILIVDDEDVLRVLIVDTLEDLGFEMEEAEDGEKALKKLKANRYDLVILDNIMPILSGSGVLEQLSFEEKMDTKILMLSAKVQSKEKAEMIEAGADYFMEKPFSPLNLAEMVEGILNA